MFRMWLDRTEVEFLNTRQISFEVLKQEEAENVEVAFVEFGSLENWMLANQLLSTLNLGLGTSSNG